jgi:hypothetical protein
MNEIVNNLGIIYKLPLKKTDFTEIKQMKKLISGGNKTKKIWFLR